MKNKIEDFYVTQFAERGFTPAPNNLDYCEVGTTWQLNDKIGTGTFWIYNRQDLFDIKIHDFYLNEDTILDFNWPECLSIMQFDSISGEELSPYRRLEAGSVKSFIGGYSTYLYLKNGPIPVVTIKVSRETIFNVLEEAVHIAEEVKKEKEKSELFRIITQISNAGIFYVNDKGQIEIANREARKLFPTVQTLRGGGGLI